MSDRRTLLESIVSWAGFGVAAGCLLAGPWLFGAWEMWWFWGLTAGICLSTLLFGLRLTLTGLFDLRRPERRDRGVRRIPPSVVVLLVALLPLLVYAFVRATQADVMMDAERSLLLIVLPVVLGLQIVFGFSRRQLRVLFLLLALNFLALGAYALINHAFDQSRHVLWVKGYAAYVNETRMTGTYFCPDHFAGIMELGLCMALGVILARETPRPWKLAAAFLAVVAVIGIVMSKSRGGGLTMLLIFGTAFVGGFAQWPPAVRWFARGAVVSLGALILLVSFRFCQSYAERFARYFAHDAHEHATWATRWDGMKRHFATMPRGRMYPAAIRAWRSAPWLGIGPGMHQHIWPHVAATDDGDRAAGRWPSQLNNTFFSYEVHSDWLQFLEEYGLVGLALMLTALGGVLGALGAAFRAEAAARRRRNWQDMGHGDYYMIPAGLLAVIAMTFHSLGDFNLQMPATTWLLGALVAMPVALRLSAHRQTATAEP